MFFRGNYNLNVDAKGRVAIPKKFRDYLQEEHSSTLVITPSLDDRCIAIYPFQEWRQLEEKIMGMPNANPKVKAMQRLFIGRAIEIPLDPQGRILLSKEQMAYANITKESTLVGQGKKFELWERATWEGSIEGALEDFSLEDMSEVLGDLSF